jgi:hypothetical protein
MSLRRRVSIYGRARDFVRGFDVINLYVPNLKKADIRCASLIPAHDMAALGMFFGGGGK